ALQVRLRKLIVVPVPPLEVVSLDAAPELAVPDVQGRAHARGHAVALALRARVEVGGRAVGGLQDLLDVPGPANRGLAHAGGRRAALAPHLALPSEVERVHL